MVSNFEQTNPDISAIRGSFQAVPFGFGGWIAFTKGDHGDVMMGDLVMTQEEVNPVMSAALDNGLSVTALHNHFFHETPRIFYMHVHGHGLSADITKRIAPALALIGKPPSRRAGATTAGKPIEGEGAPRKRDRDRGHSPSHDHNGAHCVPPPLLGQGTGPEAGHWSSAAVDQIGKAAPTGP